MDDYVAGNALHGAESPARARAAEADPGLVAEIIAYWRGQLQAADFPELTALAGAGAGDEPAAPPMTEDSLRRQFERGLAALLDGVAAAMNIS